MFVDSVDIFVASGNGGAGATSFRREKFVIQGGPDGGDGGDGGDVIFEVLDHANTLSNFRGKRHYNAQNGASGGAKKCKGKSGAHCIIKVPLGTQILNFETGQLLADMVDVKMRITLLKGGKGGLGNWHFKSSTNQAPTHSQKGIAGQSLHLKLELKLIADVGLVGYPNVGKSTLISSISNARPEVANYEFTTLTPHLGVVGVDELNSFVMADIPGIIDGAADGKGLGLQFLRHIERTKFLLFVLDGTRQNLGGMGVCAQFSNLRTELLKFANSENPNNMASKNFGIVISKCDALNDDEILKNIENLDSEIFANSESKPKFILGISSVSRQNLQNLTRNLWANITN